MANFLAGDSEVPHQVSVPAMRTDAALHCWPEEGDAGLVTVFI